MIYWVSLSANQRTEKSRMCGRITFSIGSRPIQLRRRFSNYVGFDVGGRQLLVAWQTKLTSEGISWRHRSPEDRAVRHVGDFIELTDPDGHHLALSYGFEVDREPVSYTRDLSVLGMGHVLLTVKDTADA